MYNAPPGLIAVYNLALTTADTEYSQVLPANTKSFFLKAQDATPLRFAFATGKVATPTAPYGTVAANTVLPITGVNLGNTTLYVAAGVNSKVAEIICFYGG